jgi:anti-sigma28 factor (negative regulator of flagellin synthesis)
MIQKNIQRGIYSVSSENLADKIIQELQPPAQESSPPSTS